MTGSCRAALVTGGEQGIGLGVAERLLSDGWRVVVAGINREAGAALESHFPSARFARCDVADEASVADLFAGLGKEGLLLDGMVLNAGIAAPKREKVDALALEDWERVLAVNLTGPFLCVKHGLALLRRSAASIVTIASTRATMSEPDTFAYSASKGGLVALTHSMAISLGPQVRVNAISPGWIHTGDRGELSRADHEQHPVGRVGAPQDIAGLAAYLLGEESSFITGQNFVVDGGMTRKMIYV